MSQYSSLLAPIAVDAVMRIIDPATATNVDLRDIRLVQKGTMNCLLIFFVFYHTDTHSK